MRGLDWKWELSMRALEFVSLSILYGTYTIYTERRSRTCYTSLVFSHFPIAHFSFHALASSRHVRTGSFTTISLSSLRMKGLLKEEEQCVPTDSNARYATAPSAHSHLLSVSLRLVLDLLLLSFFSFPF